MNDPYADEWEYEQAMEHVHVARCGDCGEAMPDGEAVTVVDETAGAVEVCRGCASDRRAA